MPGHPQKLIYKHNLTKGVIGEGIQHYKGDHGNNTTKHAFQKFLHVHVICKFTQLSSQVCKKKKYKGNMPARRD